ncbi:MAG: DUF559 domain-containing protein [Phycisphaerales bacterium]
MSHARQRARKLRAEQTPPEGVLWSALRNRQLGGLKFRRQHAIGRFIVDFACTEAKLVVEVDSRYHDGRRVADAARDAALSRAEWFVLRVSTGEIARNVSGVLQRILETARSRLEAQDSSVVK